MQRCAVPAGAASSQLDLCRRMQLQREPLQRQRSVLNNSGSRSLRPVPISSRRCFSLHRSGPIRTSCEEVEASVNPDESFKAEVRRRNLPVYRNGTLVSTVGSLEVVSSVAEPQSIGITGLRVVSSGRSSLNGTHLATETMNGTLTMPLPVLPGPVLESPKGRSSDTMSWPHSPSSKPEFAGDATMEDFTDLLSPAIRKQELAHAPLPVPDTSAITPSTVPQEPASSVATTEKTVEQPEIPKSIVTISIVSMMLTMASCVFNTLLPIYMVTELKMSMKSMGMFEGMLEAFSYFVRMFSGIMSDVLTSRKATITMGFAMSACAKFGMTAAGSVPQLFIGKAIDRLANGVQAAPRDALIGDLAPTKSRSACFGFAQSLRKWGSTVGALLAYCLMRASNNNYKLIFVMASAVSLLSCIAFAWVVPDHQREAGHASKQNTLSLQKVWTDVKSMGKDFYRMLGVICLYGLGHINESLLEARAIEVGFSKASSTLVVATLCFTVFLCAYPLGQLDDKYGSRITFAVGMGALALGDLILLTSSQFPMAVFIACLFWGVHWAVVQGPLLSMVVKLSPPNLRGTAFGVFYTVMAFTAMFANTVYGHVWHAYSAHAAFGLSAVMVGFTLISLPSLLPETAPKSVIAPATA